MQALEDRVRQLALADAAVLWAELLPQGARTAATLEAVPALLFALESSEANRPVLLRLLANVALEQADTQGCKRFDLSAVLRGPPFPHGDFRLDATWLARECWAAVARGVPLFKKLLTRAYDVETRSRAARLLALFTLLGREPLGELRRIALNEQEPQALRASAYVALGHFARVEVVESEGLLLSAASRIGAALGESSAAEREALVWPLVDEEAALEEPAIWPWPRLEALVAAQRVVTAVERDGGSAAVGPVLPRSSGAPAERREAVEALCEREASPQVLELLGLALGDADASVRARAVQVAGAMGAKARPVAPALMRAGSSPEVVRAVGRVATYEQCGEWLKGVESDEVPWALWSMRPGSELALREWLDARPGHPLQWMKSG